MKLKSSDPLLAAVLFGAAGAAGLYSLSPHMHWGVYVITGLLIFGVGHEALLETTVRQKISDKTDQ
jgi:hypothetical protein